MADAAAGVAKSESTFFVNLLAPELFFYF